MNLHYATWYSNDKIYKKGINLASKFEWSQLAKAVSAKLAKISGIYLGEHFTEIPLLVSILRNFNLKTFSKISASPYYYHYEVHYFLVVKKEEIAYLLKIQFHFEIDALNMVSATFENHQNIFYFIGDYRHETLNMFFSYHTLALITI